MADSSRGAKGSKPRTSEPCTSVQAEAIAVHSEEKSESDTGFPREKKATSEAAMARAPATHAAWPQADRGARAGVAAEAAAWEAAWVAREDITPWITQTARETASIASLFDSMSDSKASRSSEGSPKAYSIARISRSESERFEVGSVVMGELTEFLNRQSHAGKCGTDGDPEHLGDLGEGFFVLDSKLEDGLLIRG